MCGNLRRVEHIRLPSLYVMLPSEEERLHNQTSTFACLARDFSPSKHKFHWERNGDHILEGSSCEQKGSEANYSASSYLVISEAKWANGDTIRCIFEHTTGNLSKEVNHSTLAAGEPRVVLHPPLWKGEVGSKAQLLCASDGINMKDLAVEWTIDGQPQTTSETTGQISQLEVDTALWRKSSNYTCRVKSGKTWIVESIQVCSDGHFQAPHVQLERPRLRDVMTHDEVVVTCKVSAASSSKVVWWVDDKEETSHVTEKSEPGGRLISNITLNASTWKTLREVKCKVDHPCYPTEEAIQISETAKQNPTVTIRRSLEDLKKDDGAVLECLIGDLSSHEISVNLQANGKDLPKTRLYVDVPVQKDQQSLTAVRFTIPKDQKSADKTFACKVNFANNQKISSPTGKLFAPPTLELFLAPGSSSTKLVCVGSGFNPQLKWKHTTKLKLNENRKVLLENDGRLTVTIEMDVPRKEWHKGMNFPCEVEDQDQNVKNKETRDISICSVSPHSVFADIYLTGPSLRDKDKNNVPVTCLVVGFNISDLPVIWKVGGEVTSEGLTTLPPSENDNGTQSVRSELSLQASTWHGHAEVSCEVRRACDRDALARRISKAKDMQRPRVRILRPSDANLVHSNGSSLLCEVLGFSPADAIVHWEANGTQLPTSRYTDGPVSSDAKAGTYTTHSILLLPPSQRHEGSFTCVVRHESSAEPISDTVENLFASVVHSKPIVTLLLRRTAELVCLVYGYSPESIDITWLKNSISVEASDQRTDLPSKGPDGKFSVHSHLNLSSGEWDSGVKFTCNVTHITGALSVSTFKPEPKDEVLFVDNNMADAVPEDTVAEAMNMVWALLFLFLSCLLYSCTVTLIKLK